MRLFLPICVLLLFCVLPGEAGETRRWSNAAGTEWVNARFHRLADETVFLERENGSFVQAKLDELSELDRRYLSSLSTGRNPSALPSHSELNRETKERQQNADWILVREASDDVSATFTMKVTAPGLVAKEWIFFAGSPQVLDAQEASVRLSPDAQLVRDRNDSHRQLQRARFRPFLPK
ncbi:MAG: hypothetical protein AAGC68_15790, partial [Verrucomicrobiota bacterium]